MKFWVLFILISPSISQAQLYGFNTLGATYKVQDKSQIEITNVPPTMSQDSLGICYAYVAATMLTAQNCLELGTDCRAVTEDKLFSPVGLSPAGRVEKAPNAATKSGKKGGPQIETGMPAGGNVFNALKKVTYETHQGPSESCTSLDKILSHIGGAKDETDLQKQQFKMLQKMYDDSKSVSKDCPTCSNEFYTTAKDQIEKSFDVQLSNETMLKAFAEDTYSEFFDRIFIPSKCNRIANSVQFESADKVNLKTYPQGEHEVGNYKEAIGKIKDVIGSGHLVALGNICLDKKPSKNDQCASAHAVTVAGYRVVCSSKNQCKDEIKIINSWGQSWQDQNDGGWVDAKTLMDRTFYTQGTLTWFEKINK